MGRAEDIIRARRARANEERHRAQEQARSDVLGQEERDIARIRQLAPRVIAAATRDNYEWADLVHIEEKTLFGGFKRREVAAVAVCDYGYQSHGEPMTGTVYLLLDGRFARAGMGGAGVFDLSEAREDANYSRHGVRIAGAMDLHVGGIADGLENLVRAHRA